MDEITERLARRIRHEREERGWSLADLAERSGVSRAMISKIERGEASPTAELLNRLTTGFGLTLADIFAGENDTGDAAAPRLVRRADQPEWHDPGTGYIRRNISPPGAPGLEVVDVLFPAGGRVVFDAFHDAPILQQIWLLEGVMELTLGERSCRLEAGDCLAMTLGQPITFHNPGSATARYAVMLVRPEARR